MASGQTVDSDQDGSPDDRFWDDVVSQRLGWMDGRRELVGQQGQIQPSDACQEMLDDRNLECFDMMRPGGCGRSEAGGDAVSTLVGLVSGMSILVPTRENYFIFFPYFRLFCLKLG